MAIAAPRPGRWAPRLLGLLVLCFAMAAPALAAPAKTPDLTGRVVDLANMLSPATEAALTGKLEALEKQTGRQLVVVTLQTLQGQEIEDYGYRLGRAWGIGDAKADNGVLLIVAPNERKVRIEVGYGLEGILTDALSSVILQSAVLPKFKAGDMEGGVVAGTDALIQQLSLPDEEARAAVQKAAAAPAEVAEDFPFFLVPILLIGFFILMGFLRRRGRRRRGGWLGALAWALASGTSSGGGWSSGGGSSGGGFSGGGGSFGGGGSSGSW